MNIMALCQLLAAEERLSEARGNACGIRSDCYTYPLFIIVCSNAAMQQNPFIESLAFVKQCIAGRNVKCADSRSS